MEELLLDILGELRTRGNLDAKALAAIIRRHNKNLPDNRTHFAKKQLIPYYLKVKRAAPARWESWNIDPATEKMLLAALQVKPRRTASGVATITVLTKPWKCSSSCLYCPNDLRMPKSYLSEEPACQRAERSYFDPYLQVTARLRTLMQMGHVTDKVELIILGGTWNDYPEAYRIWFVRELFHALNDMGVAAITMEGGAIQPDRATPNAAEGGVAATTRAERIAFYESAGLLNAKRDLQALVADQQAQVEGGTLTYNEAVRQLYGENPAWQAVSALQKATLDDLSVQQRANETAEHRVVGLVVETRPDTITPGNLRLLRQLGCTKIQMGVQTLDERILQLNRRAIDIDRVRQAFELVRIFGFKIHAHFMVNLYGATAEADKLDYLRFVTEPAWLPDEVKLYPCALVAGTGLCARFEDGSWQPYSEDQLLDVLTADTLVTPPYMRISRMIRDISSQDIVAGNRKINLRQLVERRIRQQGAQVSEIRYREIGTDVADIGDLAFSAIRYGTIVSDEYFLQWVTPENRIAGFLRLSLPHAQFVEAHAGELPVSADEAMIREVHVYGRVAQLHKTGQGAQHLGLGRQLIDRASEIARDAGYARLNVISAVGTREYYRHLGFSDGELYQWKQLD